ncbi:MAG TPA: AgmX/PglI C-terminal domain-containing protein [Aquabacterium sp.]|nr:AgmX/PglI C-terminal domain-containing protein [Aquabacterium sp.]
MSFRSSALAWTDAPDDTRLFRRVTAAVLGVTAALCVTLLMSPVRKVEPGPAQTLPTPMAKLLLEHTPPPLPEMPKAELQRPSETKPETKAEAEPPRTKAKQQERAEPAKHAPVAQEAAHPAAVVTGGTPGDQRSSVEAARKRVAGLGLLAASEDIAQVRSESSVTLRTDIRQGGVGSGGAAAVGGAAANDSGSVARAMITTNSSGGSSSVSTAPVTRAIGGGGGLTPRATTVVEDNSARVAAAAAAKRTAAINSVKPKRSSEDIRQVLSRNKGALDAIFNRAARQDPSLQGKVVFEITIAPSGEVLSCKVSFTDLHSPEVEAKLVARIRMIDFGAKDVDVTMDKVSYDFLPS